MFDNAPFNTKHEIQIFAVVAPFDRRHVKHIGRERKKQLGFGNLPQAETWGIFGTSPPEEQNARTSPPTGFGNRSFQDTSAPFRGRHPKDVSAHRLMDAGAPLAVYGTTGEALGC